MADTCEYMIRVKGNLFRCFAVVGARNSERIVDINKKNGEIIFEGERKWYIDSYCDNNIVDVKSIPNDKDSAIKWGNENLYTVSIEDISRLLELEIGYIAASDTPRSLTYGMAHYCNGVLKDDNSFMDNVKDLWIKKYEEDPFFCSICGEDSDEIFIMKGIGQDDPFTLVCRDCFCDWVIGIMDLECEEISEDEAIELLKNKYPYFSYEFKKKNVGYDDNSADLDNIVVENVLKKLSIERFKNIFKINGKFTKDDYKCILEGIIFDFFMYVEDESYNLENFEYILDDYVDWEEDYNITPKEFDEALKLFRKEALKDLIKEK